MRSNAHVISKPIKPYMEDIAVENNTFYIHAQQKSNEKRKIKASSKIEFTFHVISICDNETHANVDKNLTTSLNILHYYYTIVFLAIRV